MSEFVQLEIDRGTARVTLNRPDKRNALRREMIEDLLAAVESVSSDPAVRVLLLAARGEVFCAGMDLGQMQERATSDAAAEEYRRDSEVYCQLLTALWQLPVPSVACVQGPVLAGGMGMVCACDIVIAAESVFFMLPEPMRGITASMVTPLLMHRIGPGPAGYMLLSNEKISAAHARRFGLVHDLVPTGELEERIAQLTGHILSGSRSALALTKQHIIGCLAAPVLDLLGDSVNVSARARETEDAREGLAAFLEKRKPAWQQSS